MTWLEITLVPGVEQVDAISEALTAAGAQAVTLASAAEDPLYEPPPGAMPLWCATAVTGLFPGGTSTNQILQALALALAPLPLPPHRVHELADRDWEREWLTRFGARRFGSRLWVRPQAVKLPESTVDAVEVILDPGLAFGTGTHPSTALCLNWLDQQSLQRAMVLDYGCGSGILAVAAVKLGALAALAVDIDPQAVIATQNNARANSVAAAMTAGAPELADGRQFDVVLANILANPLIELAPRIGALLAPGGRLCLAGILAQQADSVAAAYGDKLALDPPAFEQGWARITGRRRGE